MQKCLRRCGRYAVVFTFGFFSSSILWQRAFEPSAVPFTGLIPFTGTARDTAFFQAGSQEVTTYDSPSPHLIAAQAERNASHTQTDLRCKERGSFNALFFLPLVSREWKNGSNSSYNCTPFLHSLLTKGRFLVNLK